MLLNAGGADDERLCVEETELPAAPERLRCELTLVVCQGTSGGNGAWLPRARDAAASSHLLRTVVAAQANINKAQLLDCTSTRITFFPLCHITPVTNHTPPSNVAATGSYLRGS